MAVIRSVCVYCGSSDRGAPAHRAAAVTLGRLLAQNGLQLVFGGGRVGLMGAASQGARAAGGKVIGVIPEHLVRKEVGHAQVSELIIVGSMHVRKETMFARSDGFVILPGGPGTLDELFEILTWRQLGLHDKPIVLVNIDGYWDPLLALIEAIISAHYVGAKFRRFYTVVGRVEDAIPALREAGEPQIASQPARI